MAVYLRISSDDIDAWLAEHFGANLVQPNLLPPNNLEGIWLVEFTSAYELRKLAVSWSRTSPVGIPEDVAVCTFHFLNLTDGVPDDSWTNADYEDIESKFVSNLWDTLNDYYEETTILDRFTWRADGPAFKPFGASLSPTLRIAPASTVPGSVSLAGTDTGHQRLPPQVAVSVTERTDAHFTVSNVEGVGTQVRNRWGRFYLPAPSAGNALAEGRVGAGVADDFAAGVKAFYNQCLTVDMVPVMYSPTTGHAWTIDEISVDDVFDVIRSRRYAAPQYRATEAINPP